MKMPRDFIDAINEAVHAINPDAWEMTSGSMTLGADFDEFLGPEAMMKFGLGPIDAETQARFEAKWAEKRDGIKAELVRSAVDIERRRMEGFDFQKASDDFLAEDSARCDAQRNKNAKFFKSVGADT